MQVQPRLSTPASGFYQHKNLWTFEGTKGGGINVIVEIDDTKNL